MRHLTTAALAAALILTPTTALATPGHDPVTICHKPGTPAEHEITVDRDALDKHLEHGDALGPCEVVTVPTPVPTTEPTTQPTTEPTEEPTWEPTAPPTEEPSPEPVSPEPKPTVEPQPAPSEPTTPDSATSTPSSPPAANSQTATSPAVPQTSAAADAPSSSSTGTTTPRPELAETGFNRGLLALAASMVAAGAAIFLGSRWRRS